MKKLSFIGLIAMMVCSFAVTTWADKDGGKRYLPDYGKLAAKWWQWAEKYGTPEDFGLIDCSKGQKGSVWFLAGTYVDAEPQERICIDPIPKGKSLFIPLINVEVSNNDCETFGGCPTVPEKRYLADSIFRNDTMSPLEEYYFGSGTDSFVCNLSITIDGEPAQDMYPIVRRQSPTFRLSDDPKAIADGFWVLVPNLPEGEHTIEFTGAVCDVAGFLFPTGGFYRFMVGDTGDDD